ncbi:hypothetical protein QE152_g27190 [Popillia japonica]|uniref:Uncharacterized protein n=1 Tax=Popillia japonica TaxID=7064 RepID=A0AAW1JWX6_POPJA
MLFSSCTEHHRRQVKQGSRTRSKLEFSQCVLSVVLAMERPRICTNLLALSVTIMSLYTYKGRPFKISLCLQFIACMKGEMARILYRLTCSFKKGSHTAASFGSSIWR